MSLEFNKSLILAVNDDIVHIRGKRILDIDRLETCTIIHLEDNNTLIIESSLVIISAHNAVIGFQKSDIVRNMYNTYMLYYT